MNPWSWILVAVVAEKPDYANLPGPVDTTYYHMLLRANPPANMSLDEAATYLSVSPKTIRRETNDRHIKVARVGRRLIFRRTDLDRYLELRVAVG